MQCALPSVLLDVDLELAIRFDAVTGGPRGPRRYYGCDACGDRCKAVQLAWFEDDLRMATANRKNVPWIIAMSHFPVFCTGCAGNGVDASAYYASNEAERFGNANASAAAAFEAFLTWA